MPPLTPEQIFALVHGVKLGHPGEARTWARLDAWVPNHGLTREQLHEPPTHTEEDGDDHVDIPERYPDEYDDRGLDGMVLGPNDQVHNQTTTNITTD